MADIVYYANEMDENGELHFKRMNSSVSYNTAKLHVQHIDAAKDSVSADHPRTDPTLAEFYEPEPRNSEQGDG